MADAGLRILGLLRLSECMADIAVKHEWLASTEEFSGAWCKPLGSSLKTMKGRRSKAFLENEATRFALFLAGFLELGDASRLDVTVARVQFRGTDFVYLRGYVDGIIGVPIDKLVGAPNMKSLDLAGWSFPNFVKKQLGHVHERHWTSADAFLSSVGL